MKREVPTFSESTSITVAAAVVSFERLHGPPATGRARTPMHHLTEVNMQTAPRIAIADDDIDMRQWLQMVLRPMGAVVEEVEDGAELLDALAAAEEHPFDLVITDVYMPMPSGAHVVAMARTAGFTTPFLVITSFANDELRASLGRLERTRLLEKPLARSQVVAYVSAALHRREVGSLSGRAPSIQRSRTLWSSVEFGVRCVSCHAHWPAVTDDDGQRAFYCPRCIEDAADRDELYIDLGGGH
jgi:CheY-like chemotaxis protein